MYIHQNILINSLKILDAYMDLWNHQIHHLLDSLKTDFEDDYQQISITPYHFIQDTIASLPLPLITYHNFLNHHIHLPYPHSLTKTRYHLKLHHF